MPSRCNAAEKINHQLPPSPPMAATFSVANGAYVATMCIGCHGPGFSGGKRPDGSAISTVMPFGALKELDDTELQAMYAYLQTLPARPRGER